MKERASSSCERMIAAAASPAAGTADALSSLTSRWGHPDGAGHGTTMKLWVGV